MNTLSRRPDIRGLSQSGCSSKIFCAVIVRAPGWSSTSPSPARTSARSARRPRRHAGSVTDLADQPRGERAFHAVLLGYRVPGLPRGAEYSLGRGLGPPRIRNLGPSTRAGAGREANAHGCRGCWPGSSTAPPPAPPACWGALERTASPRARVLLVALNLAAAAFSLLSVTWHGIRVPPVPGSTWTSCRIGGRVFGAAPRGFARGSCR